MSGFSEVDREFDTKHNVKSTTSLSKEDYMLLHGEAKEKLIKILGGSRGKGIDIVVEKSGKVIPVEVTVLPSWVGDFPLEELPIHKDRVKKQHQQFIYINANLDEVTVVTLGMLGNCDQRGYYHIPKIKLGFHNI